MVREEGDLSVAPRGTDRDGTGAEWESSILKLEHHGLVG